VDEAILEDHDRIRWPKAVRQWRAEKGTYE
jgi:hypothetical protein